jgi:hypothetical protein
LAKLPPLWPGSITTTLPLSAPATGAAGAEVAGAAVVGAAVVGAVVARGFAMVVAGACVTGVVVVSAIVVGAAVVVDDDRLPVATPALGCDVPQPASAPRKTSATMRVPVRISSL